VDVGEYFGEDVANSPEFFFSSVLAISCNPSVPVFMGIISPTFPAAFGPTSFPLTSVCFTRFPELFCSSKNEYLMKNLFS
jgi:hypothetical protein